MKEQILAVQRMQDYIDAHLEESISLAELSRQSLFSPWYSYRLFREYTGLTVAKYVRRLRLSRSALRLKNEHLPHHRHSVFSGLRQRGRLYPRLCPGIRYDAR